MNHLFQSARASYLFLGLLGSCFSFDLLKIACLSNLSSIILSTCHNHLFWYSPVLCVIEEICSSLHISMLHIVFYLLGYNASQNAVTLFQKVYFLLTSLCGVNPPQGTLPYCSTILVSEEVCVP